VWLLVSVNSRIQDSTACPRVEGKQVSAPVAAGIADIPAKALILVAGAVAWFLYSYGYLEDDAFIHLEFARSLSQGQGFAFDGLVANGDTSPLWVVLLAMVHSIGIGWTESAKFLCVTGLAIMASGVWRVSHDLPGGALPAVQRATLVTATTVLNPFVVHWAFSGMESVTALGLSLWALWMTFLRPPGRGSPATPALLLGLGPVLRPELSLFAALVGPFILLGAWKSGQPDRKASKLTHAATLLVLLIGPTVIWSLYALHAFGSIVPNTNLAKRGGSLADIALRLASVYGSGFPLTLALLPVAILSMRRAFEIPRALWILACWPVACAAFYLADHTAVQTRYVLLSMPCLTIFVLWVIERMGRPFLWRTAVAGMLLVSVGTIWLVVVPHVTNKKEAVLRFAEVASFVRDQLPPQAPLAAYAIGEIAFRSQHPLIDVGGITRPGAVAYFGSPEKLVAWARQQGAPYILCSDPPLPGATRVYYTEMPFLGWSFSRQAYRNRQPISIYRLP
jgi:hypothetical protein